MTELRISLAAARVNAGMTQDDAAAALHCSKSSVVNWENGKVQPSGIVMRALCDLYGVALDNIRLPSESTIS